MSIFQKKTKVLATTTPVSAESGVAPTVKQPQGPVAIPAVLVKPLITEKTGREQSLGKYAFAVVPSATKGAIKVAVEKTYNVRVVAVTTANIEGKWVARGRTFGQRKNWKKAIVTLQPGQTIQLAKGV